MQTDQLPLDDFDHLEEENKFLKMKLMLEKGAVFGKMGDEDVLSPELENEFLNRIIEFETQLENRKQVKIRERLGNPGPFQPAEKLSDEEIEEAWRGFEDLMAENEISLSACSPRVTKRQLYQFILNEFLDYEMDDISVPGMMYCFIYDEFHPDPLYECEQVALRCIRQFFSRQPLMDYEFVKEGVEVNGMTELTSEEVASKVKKFTDLFDSVEYEELENGEAEISGENGCVKGSYIAIAYIDREKFTLKGTWEVNLKKDTEHEYWLAERIMIRGVDLV